jgi:dCTP deaminase
MILTGPEITAAARDGRIRITPFTSAQVNPNSCNVRLGPLLLTHICDIIDSFEPNPTRQVSIGDGGLVLRPGELYLGHTVEEVGSDLYVPLLFGRSSVGRLGLFVEITRRSATSDSTASDAHADIDPAAARLPRHEDRGRSCSSSLRGTGA